MAPVELHAAPTTAPLPRQRATALALRGIGRTFASQPALADIDLDIAAGELVALVGPSGCGKSTLLRVIAGLEDPDDGEVLYDGEIVTDLPPRQRQLAMVFQNYALYPHLTVYRNIALPLELGKLPRDEVEARVEDATRLLDIAYLLNRRPGPLSGGQRQRVALARALARQAPLYLLDEPLSQLDQRQRRDLRAGIARMHRALGATFVYATHDLAEAMAMADRILVLRHGRIAQFGTPAQLHDAPADAFVAGFVGEGLQTLAATMRQAREGSLQ